MNSILKPKLITMSFSETVSIEDFENGPKYQDRNYILPFGKHKGHTIQRIYQGCKEIPRTLAGNILVETIARKVGKEPIINRFFPVNSPFMASFIQSIEGGDLNDGDRALLNCNGYPDYIEWCLLNLTNNNKFYMKKSELNYLETLPVYSIGSLYIYKFDFNTHFQSYNIDYKLEIIDRKFLFSDAVKNMNAK